LKNTKPKLIEVLITVDQKEWKSLKRFLLLYTSEHTEYYRLLTSISQVKNLNNFESEIFRENHFQDIKHKNFLNMMSRVLEWVEDWIVYKHINENTDQNKLYLIKAYNDRGLYKHADIHAEKLEHKLLHQKGLDLLTNKHLQELKHIQYYSNNPIKYKIGYEMLNDLVKYQKLSYKEYAMTYILELYNRSELSNFDFKDLIKKTLQLLSQLEDSEVSQILKLAQNLFIDERIDCITQLFDVIKTTKIESLTEFHLIVYIYLYRKAVKKWNAGTFEDFTVLQELIEYGIESDIYLINGKIPPIRFDNLVTRLCQFSTYEAVNSFIETWIDSVDTKDKLSTLNHAKAIAYFYFDNYSNVIDRLKNVKYDRVRAKILGYSLRTIALYEINEEALLQDHIHNFKRLLRRNQKALNNKFFLSHSNLLKVIELIIKKKYNTLISISLADYTPLFYRTWFIKKGIK